MRRIKVYELFRNADEILQDFSFNEEVEEIVSAIKKKVEEEKVRLEDDVYIVQLKGCDYLEVVDDEWNGVYVQYFEDERGELLFQETQGFSAGLTYELYSSKNCYGVAILTHSDLIASESLSEFEKDNKKAVQEILDDKDYRYYITYFIASQGAKAGKAFADKLIAISSEIEEEKDDEILESFLGGASDYYIKFEDASDRLQVLAITAERKYIEKED